MPHRVENEERRGEFRVREVGIKNYRRREDDGCGARQGRQDFPACGGIAPAITVDGGAEPIHIEREERPDKIEEEAHCGTRGDRAMQPKRVRRREQDREARRVDRIHFLFLPVPARGMPAALLPAEKAAIPVETVVV